MPEQSPILATSVAQAATDTRMTEFRKTKEAVLALEMLAEGKGYKEIEAETGLTHSTISALKARHAQPLEERKAMLAMDGFDMAERLRLVVLRKLDMMADDDDQIRKASLKDLVLPWGIAQDKGMLAAEGNKVQVEHTKGKVGLEDAVKAIEEAKRLLETDVIDVTEEKE